MELSYYILFFLFTVALITELTITAVVFLHRDLLSLHMTNLMKQWAIFSMASISSSNLLAVWWLNQEWNMYGIVDRSSYVQGFMALAVMSLFIWSIIFHVKFIGKRNKKHESSE